LYHSETLRRPPIEISTRFGKRQSVKKLPRRITQIKKITPVGINQRAL